MKPEEEKDDKKPNKFEITVIYNGVAKAVEVNLMQALQAVFAHALKLFGSPGGQLGLFTESNVQLDLRRSVKDAGVSEGARLLLRPIAVRAG